MITEIKNTIFEKYQVRKNKKQKTAFIEYISEVCREHGISCRIEEKGISRNIVMGTPVEDCEVVMTAHYDTCANMIVPNFISPKNIIAYVIYQLILTAAIFSAAIGLSFLCGKFIYPELAFPVYFITLIAIILLMMVGPANKHTANDNTSGVITILNTMLSMSDEQRAKVCFVLFDNEELGLVGSSVFNRMHKKVMKNKPLINFDCVSDGDHLFAKLAFRDRKSDFGKKFTAAMEKNANATGMTPIIGTSGFYPSDQANFRHGVGVAALRRSWLVGPYMCRIHTVRDTVFNERNIECLTAAMLDFVGGDNTADSTDISAD